MAVFTYTSAMQAVRAEPGVNALPVEANPATTGIDFDPANAVDVIRSGAVMDINHHVDRAVLNWQSFDIGRNASVNFNQLNSSALTLNRIGQGSASQIFGQLNANGRIFLINQNGILFGDGAQINVHELTASTLDIPEEVFENGILSSIESDQAAFVGEYQLNPDTGQLELVNGDITIEAGATLNAAEGGRIMILAPNIENHGVINTPDGQTILAAGEKVYLTGSDDPSLRGILVEVSSGGDVTNLGEIIAERGNVTLAGLAINQNNRISATTTTSANGSIRLIARDIAPDATNVFDDNTNTIITTNTGSVTLGDNSVTEILAELDNPDTAVDDQIQYNSRVEIAGEKIHMKQNSLISARGGEVEITALADPSAAAPLGNTPVNRSDDIVVQMDAGSKIDVSGNSTTLDMSRNNITVELRGNELRDLPLQREGALRGESVVVDVRRADNFRMGDISGNLAAIERNVAERTAEGGTVKIVSEGDIRFLKGSEIDVSGGVVNYKAGDVKTTLLAQGNAEVDIHNADPTRLYDGVSKIVTRTEPGYTEGKDAGSVQFAARGIIADGTLTGSTVAGRFQREASTRPHGGLFRIGLPGGQGILDFRAPNITLQDLSLHDQLGGFSIDIDDSYSDVALPGFASDYRDQLVLSLDFLRSGGFTRADFISNGTITLTDGGTLTLAPNSDLAFTARRVNISRNIVSQSGDIDFSTTLVNQFIDINTAANSDLGLFIDDGVTLDVSGNWTNDDRLITGTFFPDSPVMLNGGSIRLVSETEGSDLDIGDNVSLLARSGAQLQANGKVRGGRGGDIALGTSELNSDIRIGSNLKIAAHGVSAGGELTVVANALSIADVTPTTVALGQDSAANGDVTVLPDYYFSDLGFSQFDITANQGDLTMADGATLKLRTSQLFLPVNALNASSRSMSSLLTAGNPGALLGLRESGVATGGVNSAFLGFAPDYARTVADLSLTAANPIGDRQLLQLADSAVITTDAGASLLLSNLSGGWIDIRGSILAPGSDISLELARPIASQQFDSSSGIIFSDNAVIDVSAKFVDFPDFALGLNRARVFDAGDISVRSSGYIVVEEGGRLDTSGKAGNFDVIGGVTSRVITRNKQLYTLAGDISFSAAEGIINDGTLNLASAPVAAAYGGSLGYTLDRGLRGDVETGIVFPGSTPELVLQQDAVRQLAPAFEAGDSLNLTADGVTPLNGRALIATAQTEATGADVISMTAVNGTITFNGSSQLNMRRDILLDAPVFNSSGETVGLNANYIGFGSTLQAARLPGEPLPTAGPGQLDLNANLIDLNGLATLRNVGQVNLNSTGDIRFRGVSTQINGEFALDGDLNLQANRVMPTTMSRFLVDASTGDITISAAGNSVSPVLSAGGNLTLKAQNLYQGGTLFAPMGEINFDVADTLTLAPGSLTSVSAEGSNILLGQTLNGLEWLYVTSGLTNARTLYSGSQQNMPEKNISLGARNIDIQEGASLNLTGGGSLVNWEFVPGPGGSVDGLLAQNADNFFAVLPGLSGFAPFDAQEFRGWDLSAGQGVFLAGGNGLAAGNYAMLPARYALLPGAFLVERIDGFDNIPLNQSTPNLFNGTLVAGYERVSGAGNQVGTTAGYVIRPGSYANQLSEFNISTADVTVSTIAAENDFVLPRLTRDAGSLLLVGQDTINLDGNLLTAAGSGGRGAFVDISADALSIVNALDTTGLVTDTELLASSLNRLGAESLLIGGRRSFTTEGTVIEVAAGSVEVDNDVALTSPEIVLAAETDLTVRSGAVLTGQGQIETDGEIYNLDGDSALVRVSAAPQVSLRRTNNTGIGTTLTLENDVDLQADRSITIDSSGDLISDADIGEDVDEIALGASAISIGDVTGVGGLILDDDKLAQLQGIDLVLRTSGPIDFYGTANLDVNLLELNASGIVADQTTPSTVVINANTVALGNLDGNTAPTSINTPSGSLTINSSRLELTEGTFAIEGFANVDANITGRTVAAGEGALDVNGELELSTRELTALDNTVFAITVSGTVTLDNAGTVAQPPLIERQIGASLLVEGESIQLDTAITTPVGNIDLVARSGDIVLEQNAAIDVSGFSIDVLGIDRISLPGGTIQLAANQGNIEIRSGSLMNVDAGGPGRSAGQIRLIATEGDVSVLGNLSGVYPVNTNANPDVELGGRFIVDAETFGQSATSSHGFAELNTLLNAGGFSSERSFRQRSGDMLIDLNNDFMLAQTINLVAEVGDITVTRANLWTVDEQQGGTISLIARDDLILDQGAWLSVAPLPSGSVQPDSRGGNIYLEAVDGNIDLRSGFLQVGSIGNDATASGAVRLRTSRNATNNDVNIDSLSTVMLGGNNIIVEGVKRYDNVSTISSAYLNGTVRAEADAFMANAGTIIAGRPIFYLDQASGTIRFDGELRVQPGIEIRNSGNISISNDLDFDGWRYGDEVGTFSVRAGGDLAVNGNIRDGIGSEDVVSCFPFGCFVTGTIQALQSGASWNYHMTAGAAINAGQFATDRMQTGPAAVGNLILANNRVIRTGTGDIVLNAANDIRFGDDRSVVYTLGRSGGFELDASSSGPTKLVPTGGGDLLIHAGNDIVGAGNGSSKTQLINEWFKRQEYVEPVVFGGTVFTPSQDAGTWLDYASFRQGIAAFGGGDVKVTAGNDIRRLSVSSPTWVTGDYDTRSVSRYGVGEIAVDAGGNIEGGIFFVGDGLARISANGDIVGGRSQVFNNTALEMDTMFAQMGGAIDVYARGDIDIESVFDPTLIRQGNNNTMFSSYTADSSSSFVSLNGNITIDPGFTDIQQNTLSNLDNSNSRQFRLLPGNARFAAIQQDIQIKGGQLDLFPSTDSSLNLYAGNNIQVTGLATILMSDEPLSLVPTLNTAINSTSPFPFITSRQFSEPPLHINDVDPSWLVAENGDITGGIYLLPEQARLYAGRDISDIRLRTQNLNPGDLTRVQAGRDIRLNASNQVISTSGPGRLEVLASRNIDLGPSIGIETRGNLTNPGLADVGADILVQAGIADGARYLEFYEGYFGPTGAYRAELIGFLEQRYATPAESDAFLMKSGDAQWSEIEQAFIPYIIEAFYSELRIAGRAGNGDFSRGFNAIDTLYPETAFNRNEAYGNLGLKLPGESNQQYFDRLAGLSDYEGDLSLFFSKVYSLDGGDINMLVPGGFVNAGLAAAPANAPDKQAGELGVVAQSFGDIRSFSRGDFQVNQSRVSTLLGGDILMWSSVGDIDAGRGSKSAIAAPEPRITISSNGDVQVDLSNTISGSGIRAVVVNPGVEPGDVDLLAPNGIVDAGDAGIASSGNINIAAVQVIGADNIQFGGVAVGVPSSNTGAVGGSGFSGAGNVAGNASRVAEDAASEDESQFPLREKIDEPQLTFISVEILGFGEEEEEQG